MSVWRPVYVLPLRMHLRMTTARIVSIRRSKRCSRRRRRRRSKTRSSRRNIRSKRVDEISNRNREKVEHV